jgi:hypothetical protein
MGKLSIKKDISKLSINQAVKLLPKKLGDRGLIFIPGCVGQTFDAYYEGKSGFGPTVWNYTLGKAIRSLLRRIKCENCGAVPETNQECGIPARWQVHGEDYKAKVFCSKRCKESKLRG